MNSYEEKNNIEKQIRDNKDLISDYENKILQLKNENSTLYNKLKKYSDYSNVKIGSLMLFEDSDEYYDTKITCMLIEENDKYNLVIVKSNDSDYKVGHCFGFNCRFIDTVINEMKDWNFKLVLVKEFEGVE